MTWTREKVENMEDARGWLIGSLLVLQGIRLGVGFYQADGGGGSALLGLFGFGTGLLVSGGLGYCLVWQRRAKELDRKSRRVDVLIWCIFWAQLVLMTGSHLALMQRVSMSLALSGAFEDLPKLAVALAASLLIDGTLFAVAWAVPFEPPEDEPIPELVGPVELIPCRNAERGCREKYPTAAGERGHQRTCQFRDGKGLP